MQILTAQQIKAADAYTISHEPVESIDLMERAAEQCTRWIIEQTSADVPVFIFCGMGNNGGDGLAIARQLNQNGRQATAFLVMYGEHFSPDCEINKTRLEHHFVSPLQAIHHAKDFPDIPDNALLVDALFGTGLSRPLEGLVKEMVEWLNRQPQDIVAIDLPSGMYADASCKGHAVIKATHTLSFEYWKLAFLMPENAAHTGEVHILPIGLHPRYTAEVSTPYHLTDPEHIRAIYKKRDSFSHKGTFGHALLISGSYGKMGAAQLAARACLRSGVGLLTCHIPACGYLALQTAVPEAMCMADDCDRHISKVAGELGQYQAIGIGPGIGRHPETAGMAEALLSACSRPIVADADMLNILAEKPALLEKLPQGSILTPHPKEFERLFGKTGNDFERLTLLLEKSKAYHIYIILKGHYSCVATPEQQLFFNPTGNAGMATGGSGDVLTGILTGLLAQQYSPLQSCILGMYLHGRAGDLAAEKLSQESMLASDIVENLGAAFKSLQKFKL